MAKKKAGPKRKPAKKKGGDPVLFEKDDKETRAIKEQAREVIEARKEKKRAGEEVQAAVDKLVEMMRDAKLKEIRIRGYVLQRVEEMKPKIVERKVDEDEKVLTGPAMGSGAPAGELEDVETTRSGKPKLKASGRTATVIPKKKGGRGAGNGAGKSGADKVPF